jgi:hypothetical protein
MKNKIALGLLFAPTLAVADAPRGSSYADEPADESKPLPVQTVVSEQPQPANAPDLRVKQMPAKMRMREKDKKKTDDKKKSVATLAPLKEAADIASKGATDGGSVSSGYKPFPTTTRDLRERVAFRIRAGTEIDTAPALADQTQRGGLPLPGGFSDTRPWIMGDAVIGARGIVTPTLNGYFMTSFAFDASDSLATRTATIMPYDNQQLAIKAGYAEYGRDDRKPDGQQPMKFWLRAGRQFRLDGGNMFAYFDGATIGWKDKLWAVSAFAGQRVALYTDTTPGVTFGGTFGADVAKNAHIYVNYQGLSIESTDFDGDGVLDGETRHLVNFGGKYKIDKKTYVQLRGRLTGLADLENATDAMGNPIVPATKFALGQLGARVRHDAGRLIVIGDINQRFKNDVAYDLAAPSSIDIVDVANKLGVGMNTPVDATQFGLQVDWLAPGRKTEVFGIARAEIPTGDQPTTVDTKGYVEIGAGIGGTPVGVRGSGVYTTAQYTFRQFTNEGKDGDNRIDGTCNDLTDLNMDGLPDNCQEFGNSASSGIDSMHQLAAEAVLTTRPVAGRHWRFAAGAFFRVFNYSTPYREVTNDSRGGGRLDMQFWFNRDLHLNVAGEIAQASPTLSREIGTMTSIRAALEARW